MPGRLSLQDVSISIQLAQQGQKQTPAGKALGLIGQLIGVGQGECLSGARKVNKSLQGAGSQNRESKETWVSSATWVSRLTCLDLFLCL